MYIRAIARSFFFFFFFYIFICLFRPQAKACGLHVDIFEHSWFGCLLSVGLFLLLLHSEGGKITGKTLKIKLQLSGARGLEI